jgi:peptide subunit release factor 1 (eRF1)
MEIGRGRGVGGPRQGLGREGRAPTKCVCPECGYEKEKERGDPCQSMKCPKCGIPLVGE